MSKIIKEGDEHAKTNASNTIPARYLHIGACKLFGRKRPAAISDRIEGVKAYRTYAIVYTSQEVTPEAVQAAEEMNAVHKCWLCGFCPEPLGICIFIWLLIIIAAGVTIYFILKRKKKKDEEKEIVTTGGK